MKEKIDILDELSELLQKDENLSLNFLITVLLSVVIFLILIFPKIYTASNIYFTSAKLQKLYKEYDILKEQNKYLKYKLEQKRFEYE